MLISFLITITIITTIYFLFIKKPVNCKKKEQKVNFNLNANKIFLYNSKKPVNINLHNVKYKTIDTIDKDLLFKNDFNDNLDILPSQNSNDKNIINYKLENIHNGTSINDIYE